MGFPFFLLFSVDFELFGPFWSNFFLFSFSFLFFSFSLFELSEKVGLKMKYWNLQNNWWMLYSPLVIRACGNEPGHR